MSEVAAQLELEALYDGTREPLVVQVLVPKPDDEDWVCTIVFTGFMNKTQRIFGVDSWQALQLGLNHTRTMLHCCGAELFYLGEPIAVQRLFAEPSAA